MLCYTFMFVVCHGIDHLGICDRTGQITYKAQQSWTVWIIGNVQLQCGLAVYCVSELLSLPSQIFQFPGYIQTHGRIYIYDMYTVYSALIILYYSALFIHEMQSQGLVVNKPAATFAAQVRLCSRWWEIGGTRSKSLRNSLATSGSQHTFHDLFYHLFPLQQSV